MDVQQLCDQHGPKSLRNSYELRQFSKQTRVLSGTGEMYLIKCQVYIVLCLQLVLPQPSVLKY